MIVTTKEMDKMCTSIISNRQKTIVGWNLDVLNMKYKVIEDKDKVFIAYYDKTVGYIPMFGANSRGDFITTPTCYPIEETRALDETHNIIRLNHDLLFQKKSLEELKEFVSTHVICSIPGIAFQSQLTDQKGNVLQVIPGQGYRYIDRPKYAVMTNFSPIRGIKDDHPWMGVDRYQIALKRLSEAKEDFDIKDCFEILKEVSQTKCPTVISMVFDVSERIVYWCENREWQHIHKHDLGN